MVDLHFPRKRSGVPVLSKKDMDALAERIMEDYNPDALKHPQPIDVDDFAQNYLGMEQDFQYLSHCGVYLGMTVFNDTDEVPVYNPNTNEAEYISARARTIIIDNTLLADNKEHRYRFTMGHEAAGHGVLHEEYFAYDPYQFSLMDESSTPMIQCRTDMTKLGSQRKSVVWGDREWMEWQANVMSSCFMMPQQAVRTVVAENHSKNNYLRNNKTALAYTDIKAVSQTFNMSTESALYRLKELELIPSDFSTCLAGLDFIDVLIDADTLREADNPLLVLGQ